MRDLVEARGIDFVWHFTRLSNLDNILRNGLINRTELNNTGVDYEINDQHRLDGHEDAICCSIAHPNYKMFYSLRKVNPEVEWVVIGLKPSVLWEKDCAFCVTNAASNEVTEISLQQRKGAAAFNRIYEELPGKPLRVDLGISDRCPTNPQAEILVFGNIETKYIIGAITQNKAREGALKAQYPDYQFVYNKGLFSARKDYVHWK